MKNIVIIMLIMCISLNYNSYTYAKFVKPTRADWIKDKYENEDLTDAEIKALIKQEEIIPYNDERKNKLLKEKKESMFDTLGNYQSIYSGAINYNRSNFLMMTYSLLDTRKLEGRQPLMQNFNSGNLYKTCGFPTYSWIRRDKNNKVNGFSSTDVIRWLVYQFEPKKLLKVYKDIDYKVLNTIANGNINDLIELNITKNIEELDSAKPGDILLDIKDNKIINIGVYLGKDEISRPYAAVMGKHITNSKSCINGYTKEQEIMAYSHVNSSDLYLQKINGEINLIPGTRFTHYIKLKFLEE